MVCGLLMTIVILASTFHVCTASTSECRGQACLEKTNGPTLIQVKRASDQVKKVNNSEDQTLVEASRLDLLQRTRNTDKTRFKETYSHLNEVRSKTNEFCVAQDTLCQTDADIFPELQSLSAKDFEIRLEKCNALHSNGNASLSFRHIPKAAGRAVESFLGIPFQGHRSIRQQPLGTGTNFVVVLRHPLERIVSWYYFLMSGENQNRFKERQRHFCKADTGKLYRTACVPKLSVYEFAMSEQHSIYEAGYLGFHDPSVSDSDAIGTDANFMFEYLKPAADSSMADTKELLLTRFVAIGDTKQFSALLLQLSYFQGMDMSLAVQKIRDLDRNHVNPTKHASVDELFSEQQYQNVVHRHAKDIELYYWASQQAKALTECIGAQKWLNGDSDLNFFQNNWYDYDV